MQCPGIAGGLFVVCRKKLERLDLWVFMVVDMGEEGVHG